MKKYLNIVVIVFTLIGHMFLISNQNEFFGLKTVFVERFTRFIKWPKNIKEEAKEKFVIGIFGNNALGGDIKKIFKELKIKIKNKDVEFKYFKNLKELQTTHILIISANAKKSLNKILAFTKSKPILTIGDHQGFAEKGVLINFFTVDDSVKFEINETAVHQSGLSISYLLLQAGKIINRLEME